MKQSIARRRKIMRLQQGCLLGLTAAGFALVFAGSTFALSTSDIAPPTTTIADDTPNARFVAVQLNAGETYVISDLGADNTPEVRVVSNPHALIMRTDAARQIVLLAAAAGDWELRVRNAAGQAVLYRVTVKAIAHPFDNPLTPGMAPPALGSTDSPDKPAPVRTAGGSATVALDTGSGPVAARSTDDTPRFAPPAVTAQAASLQAASVVDSPTPPSPISQLALSAQPAQIPLEKFRSDPLVEPSKLETPGPRGANYLPADVVRLMTGTSRIFDFPRRLRRISVADTEVADIQVVDPYQINLIAHKAGFTTLAVWDLQGGYDERQIRVDPYGKQQVLLNCVVAELDRNRMETQAINWSGALPNYNVSLLGIGPGGAATPYDASSILSSSALVGTASGNPTTLTQIPNGTVPNGGQIIPLLLSQSLNYGLAWGNSVGQTQAFFNFLETHSLAKVLAEPHLLANSGEKAEFLSGGEIPIVIAQALNTSIVFKQFGTSVIFVPTVVGADDIELEVKPEVSEPDYAHAVSEFGFTIPAFVTRRAKTYVQMKNNQTLIIAGLLLHNKTSEVDKTPYLGDLPWIGNFFKHTSYTDQNTDLVMTVTPQLVQPLPPEGRVANPVDRGPLSEDEIRTAPLPVPDASRPRF